MALAELNVDQRAMLGDIIREHLDRMSRREAVAELSDWAGWDELKKIVVQAAIDDGEAISKEEQDEATGKLQYKIDKLEQQVEEVGRDADLIHRAIWEGDRETASSLLRDMLPEHPFLSDAAARMVAGFSSPTLPGLL